MLRITNSLRVLCKSTLPHSAANSSIIPFRSQSNKPVPADNKIEVFVDDIPVRVEPGTTVLQVRSPFVIFFHYI